MTHQWREEDYIRVSETAPGVWRPDPAGRHVIPRAEIWRVLPRPSDMFFRDPAAEQRQALERAQQTELFRSRMVALSGLRATPEELRREFPDAPLGMCSECRLMPTAPAQLLCPDCLELAALKKPAKALLRPLGSKNWDWKDTAWVVLIAVGAFCMAMVLATILGVPS